MRNPSLAVWPLLAVVLLLGESRQAVAQDPNVQLVETQPEWNVLYGHERFGEAAEMLPNYVRKLLDAANTERSRVIADLQTPAALSRYQDETRAKLRAALGEFPARNPLNAQVSGVLERGDYAIEKVVFESRPRYYVTANVYVPRKARPPYPAVLAPVGHWGLGKAFEEYQRLGAFLARRGYLVMVYDVPGQGERRQYFNQTLGRALIDPGTSHWFVTLEHGYAGGQAILTTGNYASHLVWDGIRGIDYLSGREDVDPERIACTGTSGGGLQTELLSAVDDRIKVSIPVCYGGCNPDNPTRKGLSITDIDALIVPRPLLMIEATGDPRASVLKKQQRHQEIARLYEVLGQPAKTRYMIAEGPHGYIESMYEASYAWMERWWSKSGSKQQIKEPIVAAEPTEALFSTATGEVTTSLGGETVFTLNRATARKLRSGARHPKNQAELPAWRRQTRDKVLSRLGIGGEAGSLDPQRLIEVDKGSYKLEKIVYYSEPEIYVPGLLFLPQTPGPHPAVVFVNEGGKAGGGVVEDYVRPLVEAGHVVFSIDPRGMGETHPKSPRASTPTDFKQFVHDDESNFYYNTLRVGKTPMGMRATDVMRAVDYLASRADIDGDRISAIGHGLGGLIVLYAAAVDARIASVACTRSLVSYEAIVENEIYTHRFTSFGPGFLKDFDLPEVAALVAPRPLLLVNPVDQLHRVASPDEVETTYQPTASVYGLAGEASHFTSAHSVTAKRTAEHYLDHLKRR